MIITTIIASLIAEMMLFYGAFAITKKFFRKRPTSYLLSGATILVWFSITLFRKDVDKELSKVGIIISMILAAIVILAFYIGEKRALASGKHCGDFELDRSARKFAPYSIKKTFSKFKYPFLKEKGIFNNIEIVPANKMVNTETVEYKAEVAQRKFTYHFIHWFFMFCWYMIVLGIWMWYFMGYGVYWMFAAAIDTFKDLYTKDGSKFSLKSAISDIANSDELTNGIKAVKNTAQTVSSKTGSAISEINQKAVSALAEHKKNKEASKENINTDIQDNISDNVIMSSRNDTPNKSVPVSDNCKNTDNTPEIEETTWSEISPLDSDNIDDIDDVDEDSAWGNSSSPLKKNEPVTSSEANDKTNAQLEVVTSNEANNDSVHDAPVQNVKQPENISSPAPNLNVPQSQGYVIQKQKTNPVLIIVIIVLVLIIGVLGGMFFMMGRNDKSDNSSNNIPASDVVDTTAEITEATTKSPPQTTTVEKTTTVETTTATTTQPEKNTKTLTAYPESDISKYPQYIKAAENNRDSGLADYFALVDINADNIPELFLTGMDGRIYAIYTAVGNDYAELQRVGGTGRDWITLYNDGCISHGASFGNDGGYTDYEYSGGNELNEIRSYSLDEYNDISSSHGGEESITVSSLANYVTQESDISNKYTTYDTSAATSDFVFFNEPALGIIATQNDPLNLRSMPSSDSEIVTKMNQNAYCSIYGQNSDWCYVSYTENGITYYGYASRQFIGDGGI